MLVLDGWADSRAGEEPAIPGSVLSDLSAALYIAGEDGHRSLGLVVATSATSPSQLIDWARYMRGRGTSEGLVRFSEEVLRWFRPEVHPQLSRVGSLELLEANGVDDERSESAVDYLGGWPKMLISAAKVMRSDGLTEAVRKKLEDEAWGLLCSRGPLRA